MKKPPLESKASKKIRDYVISRGGFAFKVWGSPQQEKGIPDNIGCYRGRFLGLETKRYEGEQPSPYQRYQLDRITAAGGVATVIHSVEEAKHILDRIDEELGGPALTNHN